MQLLRDIKYTPYTPTRPTDRATDKHTYETEHNNDTCNEIDKAVKMGGGGGLLFNGSNRRCFNLNSDELAAQRQSTHERRTHMSTSNSPDEVEESVGRIELGGGPVSLELGAVSSHPRLDADGQHDAQDDGEEGGGGEVSDGPEPHSAASLGVQTGDASDERGQDDGQNEHLEHPHQDLSRELQVHELALGEDVAVASDEADGGAHNDGDEKQKEQEVLSGVFHACFAHTLDFLQAVELLLGDGDVDVGVDFVRVLLGRSDCGTGRGV